MYVEIGNERNELVEFFFFFWEGEVKQRDDDEEDDGVGWNLWQ